MQIAYARAPLFLGDQLESLCRHAQAWRKERDHAQVSKGKRFRPVTALLAVESIDEMLATQNGGATKSTERTFS